MSDWCFPWNWSKPQWLDGYDSNSVFEKNDTMSKYFFLHNTKGIWHYVKYNETWYVTRKIYLFVQYRISLFLRMLNVWALLGICCGTFIAAYMSLRGGVDISQTLQFANYCAFLNFTTWFLYRMNMAAVAGTNWSYISLLFM